MYHLPKYCDHSYYKLKNSNLVKNKNISEENLLFFETHLNNALPKYENHIQLYNFVRELYKYKILKIYNNLDNTPFSSLILWTSNMSIVKHFGLEKLIYIRWIAAEKTYKVELYKTKNTNEVIEEFDNIESFDTIKNKEE